MRINPPVYGLCLDNGNNNLSRKLLPTMRAFKVSVLMCDMLLVNILIYHCLCFIICKGGGCAEVQLAVKSRVPSV